MISAVANFILPMLKIIKKMLLIILMILFLFFALFLIARYGWRLFGFSACSNTVMCTEVSVENGEVHIEGGTWDSISSCVGYIYRIEDGSLYVGTKYNVFLGFFRRDGGFNIRFQPKEAFRNIYFKGSNGVYEKPIWIQ